LIDHVLNLVEASSSTPYGDAMTLVDEELSDGRHSPHAHSYDLLYTLQADAIHPTVAVAKYYSKAVDRVVSVASPASRAGALMASLRLLVLYSVKLHVFNIDGDGNTGNTMEDARARSILSVCKELHTMMALPETSSTLEKTDGLQRYKDMMQMRSTLFHVDQSNASRNGIMTKLKNLRELPQVLATALGEVTYSRESPLVNLLINVCEFMGTCLINRLSTGLKGEYSRGMQVMNMSKFPELQIDTIRPVVRPPALDLTRDDSMSDAEESPVMSIAMPSQDSQEELATDYDSQATLD
jgi:hypothetical protein